MNNKELSIPLLNTEVRWIPGSPYLTLTGQYRKNGKVENFSIPISKYDYLGSQLHDTLQQESQDVKGGLAEQVLPETAIIHYENNGIIVRNMDQLGEAGVSIAKVLNEIPANEIPLGVTADREIYTIEMFPAELQPNVAIVGKPGSGKTVLAQNIQRYTTMRNPDAKIFVSVSEEAAENAEEFMPYDKLITQPMELLMYLRKLYSNVSTQGDDHNVVIVLDNYDAIRNLHLDTDESQLRTNKAIRAEILSLISLLSHHGRSARISFVFLINDIERSDAEFLKSAHTVINTGSLSRKEADILFKLDGRISAPALGSCITLDNYGKPRLFQAFIAE